MPQCNAVTFTLQHTASQIGCGKSYLASGDTAPPAEDYSLELFLDELRAVKSALGLERCHVLGHGWGGMLALTALSRATEEEKQAVASLSLASVPPSYKQLIQDRQKRVRDWTEHPHTAEA